MYDFATSARRAGRLKTSLVGLFAALSLTAVPSAASAATYVYDFLGSLTSNMVTGTITTDINAGVLGLSNILSWDITLDAGTGSANLNPSNSAIVGNYSNGITATATGLFFDFSGSPTQYIEWWDTTSFKSLVGYCSGPPGCAVGYEQVAVQVGDGGGHFRYAGVQRIATIAPTAPVGVPEPASWALIILGFGAVGATLRRRVAAATA